MTAIQFQVSPGFRVYPQRWVVLSAYDFITVVVEIRQFRLNISLFDPKKGDIEPVWGKNMNVIPIISLGWPGTTPNNTTNEYTPYFPQKRRYDPDYVFCNFLALVLRKELDRRLLQADHRFE